MIKCKRTYGAYLLGLIFERCRNDFRMLSSNWTARGAEAVIEDRWDGQRYKLTIEGLNESEQENTSTHSI